ncbi:uncharacterized protein N7483_008196 [Penicillium malachiteum]|uniref:uncharacterized protein n=1 Tax=Penicillium malachiteum TaxID=1324776 RepID=UPI00254720C2|nr:uncharacterized protein N7483_008196 [Penicillium malachiteum]KAJ5720262.1 hypothetical protein N7483_008196 [Penicillium malachiteum]
MQTGTMTGHLHGGAGEKTFPRIEADSNHQSGQHYDQFTPHQEPYQCPNPRQNPQVQSTTTQSYNKNHHPGWGFCNSSASGQDWQQGCRNKKRNKNLQIQKPGSNSSRRQRNTNVDTHLWRVTCGEGECWKDGDGDVVMSEAHDEDPWVPFNVSRTYDQVW